MKKISTIIMSICLIVGMLVINIDKPVMAASEKLEIVNTEYRQPGEYIVTFSNDSFIYVNEAEKIYSFTPVECGDWNYELNSMEELNNLVETYTSIYNTTVDTPSKLEVDGIEYRGVGEYLIIFNNDSFIYVNESEKIYSFTPAECGDWDYRVDSMESLNNLVATYKSLYETGEY